MEQLVAAHAQHRADGVEDGEHRALIRVVRQHSLTGAGNAGLERVADDPDEVNQRKQDVAHRHHRFRNERKQDVQADNGNRHDDRADYHERAELAPAGAGAIHQRANNRVGNGVADAHNRNHQGGIQP